MRSLRSLREECTWRNRGWYHVGALFGVGLVFISYGFRTRFASAEDVAEDVLRTPLMHSMVLKLTCALRMNIACTLPHLGRHDDTTT